MDTITLGEEFISRDFKNKKEIIKAISGFCESKNQKSYINIYKEKAKYGEVIGITFSNKFIIKLTIDIVEASVKHSMKCVNMFWDVKFKRLNK